MADNEIEELVDGTEFADGDDEVVETTDNETVEDTEQDEKKARTKEYSERLNKEREKIRAEIEFQQQSKLNAIAKTRGFDTWDELEEYSERERLEHIGVTDHDGFKSLMEEMIQKNPTVKQAQEILAKQEQERRDSFVKEQIKEINSFDTDIKTIDDLTRLDRYDDLIKKVEKGYDLVDAYKLVYFDKVKNKEVESTKQKVLNNLESKEHLKTVSGGAAKEIHVPADIMAMYKKNIPSMSEADIRKHYAKMNGSE